MAGPTHMAWVQGSLIARIPDGASASAMGMATILGTPGGDPWATTDAAGIRITGGARGVEPQLLTSTEFGATQRTRAPERLGQILTPGIMERQPAVPITI